MAWDGGAVKGLWDVRVEDLRAQGPDHLVKHGKRVEAAPVLAGLPQLRVLSARVVHDDVNLSRRRVWKGREARGRGTARKSAAMSLQRKLTVLGREWLPSKQFTGYACQRERVRGYWKASTCKLAELAYLFPSSALSSSGTIHFRPTLSSLAQCKQQRATPPCPHRSLHSVQFCGRVCVRVGRVLVAAHGGSCCVSCGMIPNMASCTGLGVPCIDGLAEGQLIAHAAVAVPEGASLVDGQRARHVDGLKVHGEGRARADRLRHGKKKVHHNTIRVGATDWVGMFARADCQFAAGTCGAMQAVR